MRDLSGLSNVVLTGMMGTGKSTVGKRLAQRMEKEFFDSDPEIELTVGMTIPEIFSRYGEVRFRSEEKLVIKKLAALKGIVLATGGGAVLDPENLAALRRTGAVITLEADIEVFFERAARKGDRPLLRPEHSRESVQKLLDARRFAYDQGDFKVDTTDISPDEVVDIILERLEESGFGQGQS